MKPRDNSSRDNRRDSDKKTNRDRGESMQANSRQEPPMRFTDQDQELAAETVVRSDNPSAP